MSSKPYPRLEFEFVCTKCGKLYTITTTQSTVDRGEYRKHCSRNCANGRVHTVESRTRISAKLKGRTYPDLRKKTFYDRECKCGSSFRTTDRSREYCCRKCAARFGRDFSHINKQAYLNGKRQAGGTTKWYVYKDIKVQGTYELRTCRILDMWKDDKRISGWEYTKDRFQYTTNDGTKRTYLLDFKVFRLDGTSFYIETKGYIKELDPLKWSTVRSLGHELLIWFKEDIEREEKLLAP